MGWLLAFWKLVHPLTGVIFSPARCPHHPPHRDEAKLGSRFSRRRLNHETACTGLHGTSGSQRPS